MQYTTTQQRHYHTAHIVAKGYNKSYLTPVEIFNKKCVDNLSFSELWKWLALRYSAYSFLPFQPKPSNSSMLLLNRKEQKALSRQKLPNWLLFLTLICPLVLLTYWMALMLILTVWDRTRFLFTRLNRNQETANCSSKVQLIYFDKRKRDISKKILIWQNHQEFLSLSIKSIERH